MPTPVDYLPPLTPPPPDDAAYPPYTLRVRRPVLAEPEVMLAATAGHLATWRTLRRAMLYVDRDNTSSEPAPGSASYNTIGGGDSGVLMRIGQRGPFATHVELIIHYRVNEGSSGTPEILITLEEDDALDGTDIDAPVAEATNGITLTGDSLPGDEDGAEFRMVTVYCDALEDTPSSYPTGPRALDYHSAGADDTVQIRFVPTAVDIIAIQAIERIRF